MGRNGTTVVEFHSEFGLRTDQPSAKPGQHLFCFCSEACRVAGAGRELLKQLHPAP